MRAVDTNVVVRLLTRDNPRETASAEAFVAKGAWVSHIVLVEVIWVLDSVFELSHKQLVTAVNMLLSHRDLVLQDPEVVAAALARFRRRPKLGFSDCMSARICSQGRVPSARHVRQSAEQAGRR